eukprot:4285221-Amphidinium_carterae.1
MGQQMNKTGPTWVHQGQILLSTIWHFQREALNVSHLANVFSSFKHLAMTTYHFGSVLSGANRLVVGVGRAP